MKLLGVVVVVVVAVVVITIAKTQAVSENLNQCNSGHDDNTKYGSSIAMWGSSWHYCNCLVWLGAAYLLDM
jgi:hypothetical protein